MMTGEGPLGVIAQIALALAGFTGVVMVYQRRDDQWARHYIRATEFIFEHVFGVAFASLFPFALFHTLREVGGTPEVWRISSVGLAFAIIILAGAQASRIFWGSPDVQPRHRGSFLYAYFPLSVGILILQILNVAVWNTFAAYFWALLVLLFAPGVQFWYLVQFAMQDSLEQRALRARQRKGRTQRAVAAVRHRRLVQRFRIASFRRFLAKAA